VLKYGQLKRLSYNYVCFFKCQRLFKLLLLFPPHPPKKKKKRIKEDGDKDKVINFYSVTHLKLLFGTSN